MKNASAFGICKSGFSLLELIIILFLLGLTGAIIIPNLRFLAPDAEKNEFINRINSLVDLAWQQAIAQQKKIRFFFDIEKRIMQVEIEDDMDDAGKPKFKQLDITYLSSTYHWPSAIVIKQFFIDGIEMMERPGIKTETVWFYISAEGITQEVILNIHDISANSANPKKVSLVLNPFKVKFKEYNEFQKP